MAMPEKPNWFSNARKREGFGLPGSVDEFELRHHRRETLLDAEPVKAILRGFAGGAPFSLKTTPVADPAKAITSPAGFVVSGTAEAGRQDGRGGFLGLGHLLRRDWNPTPIERQCPLLA